jgi:hypothetical protein
MTSAVTVESDSAAGEHFELTLERAANDQGTIRIKSWRSDQDHHCEGPDKDDLVPLYGSIAIGNVRLYIYRHAIDANSVSSDFGGGLRLHELGSVMAFAWAMPRLRRTRCRWPACFSSS